MQGQAVAAGGGIAGDFKYRGAADAVLGEENFPLIFGQNPAAPAEGQAGGGFDALESPGISGVGLYLHQGGIQGRAVVAQGLGQLIAVQHPAHLAARRAAAGQDHLIYVGVFFSGEKGDGEGVALFAQVGHAVSAEQVQPGMLQGVA